MPSRSSNLSSAAVDNHAENDNPSTSAARSTRSATESSRDTDRFVTVIDQKGSTTGSTKQATDRDSYDDTAPPRMLFEAMTRPEILAAAVCDAVIVVPKRPLRVPHPHEIRVRAWPGRRPAGHREVDVEG